MLTRVPDDGEHEAHTEDEGHDGDFHDATVVLARTSSNMIILQTQRMLHDGLGC